MKCREVKRRANEDLEEQTRSPRYSAPPSNETIFCLQTWQIETLSVSNERRGKTMFSDQPPTTRIGTTLVRRPCGYLPPYTLHSHLAAVVQGCQVLREQSTSLQRERQQLVEKRRLLLEK